MLAVDGPRLDKLRAIVSEVLWVSSLPGLHSELNAFFKDPLSLVWVVGIHEAEHLLLDFRGLQTQAIAYYFLCLALLLLLLLLDFDLDHSLEFEAALLLRLVEVLIGCRQFLPCKLIVNHFLELFRFPAVQEEIFFFTLLLNQKPLDVLIILFLLCWNVLGDSSINHGDIFVRGCLGPYHATQHYIFYLFEIFLVLVDGVTGHRLKITAQDFILCDQARDISDGLITLFFNRVRRSIYFIWHGLSKGPLMVWVRQELMWIKDIFSRGDLETSGIKEEVLVKNLVLDNLLTLAANHWLNLRVTEKALRSCDLSRLRPFVEKGAEILDNEVHWEVLVRGPALLWVLELLDQAPLGNYKDLVSESSELDVWMILAEIIDGIFCEMAFDKMIAIAQPNVRDGVMYVNSHRLLELWGDLIEIEVSI